MNKFYADEPSQNPGTKKLNLLNKIENSEKERFLIYLSQTNVLEEVNKVDERVSANKKLQDLAHQ